MFEKQLHTTPILVLIYQNGCNHQWSSTTYVTGKVCSRSYVLQFCEHRNLSLPDLTTLQEDIIPWVPIPDLYTQSISTTAPIGGRSPPHISTVARPSKANLQFHSLSQWGFTGILNDKSIGICKR